MWYLIVSIPDLCTLTYSAIRGQGHPKNEGYIHVVEIESSMLHDKFHYHTILGCDVTDFKYVTENGRGDHFVMCLDPLCKAKR